jgi:hypothetical protein
MEFILIPNGDTNLDYPVGTDAEIALAQQALRDAEMESAPVWAGDPEGDHVRNGRVLHAD